MVALLACVALATIFVVSGVAKLADRDGTREAVAGFGVPPSLVRPVALGLAPAEIVVAVLVLVPATAAVGLVLALGLLLAFTAAVVIALRAGRRPECHCFGRIGGADVSARTVVRNLALAGARALSASAGWPPATRRRAPASPSACSAASPSQRSRSAPRGLAGPRRPAAARTPRTRLRSTTVQHVPVERLPAPDAGRRRDVPVRPAGAGAAVAPGLPQPGLRPVQAAAP